MKHTKLTINNPCILRPFFACCCLQISRELDALSHFHFTPRPVVPDSKIRTLQTSASASAVSSLHLEDITPLTSAQASTSQLAPEQVSHGQCSVSILALTVTLIIYLFVSVRVIYSRCLRRSTASKHR